MGVSLFGSERDCPHGDSPELTGRQRRVPVGHCPLFLDTVLATLLY